MNKAGLLDGPDVQGLLSLQQRKTDEWHEAAFAVSKTGLLALVEENHRCNFELWHQEDKARRDDRGYEYVHRAKRRIDRWNQRRNDVVERIDEWIAARAPAPTAGSPMNSESPGMIIDRLSILALKEYHMAEEAKRADAPESQRARCRERLEIVGRQRADLGRALVDLLTEIARGTRGFCVYYQLKMYNDPGLNPELYKKR